jgi:hypothetical protein
MGDGARSSRCGTASTASYFTGTAAEALEEYNRVKDDLIDGREPRSKAAASSSP